MTDRNTAIIKQKDWLDQRAYELGEFEANQTIYDSLAFAFTNAARTVLSERIGIDHGNLQSMRDSLVAFEATLTDLHDHQMPPAMRKALTADVLKTLEDEQELAKFSAMHADMLEDDAITCGQQMINMLLGSEGMHKCMDNPSTLPVTPELLRPALTPTTQSWNEIAAYGTSRYALAPQDMDELICIAWKNLGGGARDVPLNTKLTIPGATISAALAHKFTGA
jgi:hypothetical protein